jgi:hypothetical protein
VVLVKVLKEFCIKKKSHKMDGEISGNKTETMEIPRWRLEGGSRKRTSYSEILEKCWRHTLQAKPPRRGKL